MELELAISLSKRNNTDETLQADLDMNEVNIRGLLEEIKELKKEIRTVQLDNPR